MKVEDFLLEQYDILEVEYYQLRDIPANKLYINWLDDIRKLDKMLDTIADWFPKDGTSLYRSVT